MAHVNHHYIVIVYFASNVFQVIYAMDRSINKEEGEGEIDDTPWFLRGQ